MNVFLNTVLANKLVVGCVPLDATKTIQVSEESSVGYI